jgi:hypothetical protein
MIEVIMEYDVTCPRCKALEKKIKEICNMLDIPLIMKLVSTKSVAAYEESVASKTLTREWVERFGTKEQKEAFSRIEKVFGGKTFPLQATPTLAIRFGDSTRNEIVIRGYDDSDKEKSNLFLANLYILLKALRGAR